MAKCIRKDGEIKRLPENNIKDVNVISIHINNGWNFIPKSEWKKSVRAVDETVKVEKIKKKKKEKSN